MDRLAQVEEAAKAIIENKLLGLFPGKVPPVTLAKEVLKELIARKEHSVTQSYAPNYFKVYLHPRDCEAFLQLGKEFLYEVERFLKQQAAERDLALMGPLKVDLAHEAELMEGIVIVEWDFLPDVSRREIETLQENENLREDVGEEPTPGGEPAYLMSIEGYGQGNIYPLEKNEILIGQDEGNDILLKAPLVAAQHARILRVGRDYLIQDLGSPSGIYINLRRVKEKKLQEGDRLAVGRCVMQFHLS